MSIVHETCSVKEIAERLNQPASQLYYHTNMLEKHGLIRVFDTRIVFGIIERWYGAAAFIFRNVMTPVVSEQLAVSGE